MFLARESKSVLCVACLAVCSLLARVYLLISTAGRRQNGGRTAGDFAATLCTRVVVWGVVCAWWKCCVHVKCCAWWECCVHVKCCAWWECCAWWWCLFVFLIIKQNNTSTRNTEWTPHATQSQILPEKSNLAPNLRWIPTRKKTKQEQAKATQETTQENIWDSSELHLKTWARNDFWGKKWLRHTQDTQLLPMAAAVRTLFAPWSKGAKKLGLWFQHFKSQKPKTWKMWLCGDFGDFGVKMVGAGAQSGWLGGCRVFVEYLVLLNQSP